MTLADALTRMVTHHEFELASEGLDPDHQGHREALIRQRLVDDGFTGRSHFSALKDFPGFAEATRLRRNQECELLLSVQLEHYEAGEDRRGHLDAGKGSDPFHEAHRDGRCVTQEVASSGLGDEQVGSDVVFASRDLKPETLARGLGEGISARSPDRRQRLLWPAVGGRQKRFGGPAAPCSSHEPLSVSDTQLKSAHRFEVSNSSRLRYSSSLISPRARRSASICFGSTELRC